MENSSAKVRTKNDLSPSERATRLIVSITTNLLDSRLSATNQEIGRQFALLTQRFDEFSKQIETLRAENSELRQNLIELHAEYNEVREYAKTASNSAASAKADNRYLGRAIERTNLVSEIVVILVDSLIEPFYEWAGAIIKKRDELDPRKQDTNSLRSSSNFIDRRKR